VKHVHAFGDDVLADLDAVGVARAVAAREVSAAEVLEAALARIDAVNPQLAAVAVDDRERARARAVSNGLSGVFAGVPSMIKNNTAFAGLVTGNGSAATPDVPAAKHAPFTEEFVGTGVNVLGATTLPVFGLTATTEFVDRPPTQRRVAISLRRVQSLDDVSRRMLLEVVRRLSLDGHDVFVIDPDGVLPDPDPGTGGRLTVLAGLGDIVSPPADPVT